MGRLLAKVINFLLICVSLPVPRLVGRQSLCSTDNTNSWWWHSVNMEVTHADEASSNPFLTQDIHYTVAGDAHGSCEELHHLQSTSPDAE